MKLGWWCYLENGIFNWRRWFFFFRLWGTAKKVLKKRSRCLWESWLSLIIHVLFFFKLQSLIFKETALLPLYPCINLSVFPSFCSLYDTYTDGILPARGFSLVHAAICAEGTVMWKCNTVNKIGKAQEITGLRQSPITLRNCQLKRLWKEFGRPSAPPHDSQWIFSRAMELW